MSKFKEWCQSGTAAAKCTRTIAQGCLSALILYLPDIITGAEVIPSEYKALCVALVMAVLAPLQAQIGAGGDDGACND